MVRFCPSCAFGFEPLYSLDYLSYASSHGYDESFQRFLIIKNGEIMSLEEILKTHIYSNEGIEALLFGYIKKNYFENKMFCIGCLNSLKTILKKTQIKNVDDIEFIVTKLLAERLKTNIKKLKKIKGTK